MNAISPIDLKRMLNKFMEVEFAAASSVGVNVDREMLEYEFQAIGLYVSGADNNVSKEEIDLLNFLFDLNLNGQTVQEMVKVLRDRYNDTIENLQMIGWTICKGLDMQQNTQTATNFYMNITEQLMYVFSEADGKSDAKETAFINSFLNKMRQDRR